MKKWTKDSLDEARETLSRHKRSDFATAVEEIGIQLGTPITQDSLRNAFKRGGLNAPTSYCASQRRQEGDPPSNNTEAIADVIREVAAELGVAPLRVTQSEVITNSLVSEEDLKNCGGLGAIKKVSFQISGLESSDTPSLNQVVRWIQMTADALEVHPVHVARDDVRNMTPATTHHFSAYGGFKKIKNDAFGIAAGNVIDHAAKRGLDLRTSYTRKLEREVGQREYLGQRLERTLRAAFEASPPTIVRVEKTKAKLKREKRVLVGLWSDLHFGINVDPREVPGGGYDWKKAARRMAKLCREIADWKREHRSETRLQLVLNGDVIAGRIHTDDQGILRITEQVHGAISILVGCIGYLEQHFGRIDVMCLPGNHERTTRERQFSQRWDSYGTHIYIALVAAFRKSKNVNFEIPRTGEGVFELPGGEALAYASHGDVEPTMKNVGRALNLGEANKIVDQLNASGEFGKPVRVLLWGHWHTPLVMQASGATIGINGSVIGVDAYARAGVGIRRAEPTQLVFESTETTPFAESRLITLGDADEDESLDEIVHAPSLDLAEL
jgi:hypothetical protein